MNPEWTPLLHEIGTIIAGVAAVIAAASSLANGRVLNGHLKARDLKRDAKRDKATAKRTKNGASPAPAKSEQHVEPDWFKPPDLK